MPREGRVEAQAKINLVLRILAREPSGYHELETVFCRIMLSDTVTVRETGGDRTLELSGSRVPAEGLGPVDRNLAWRAASAYAAAAGFPAGFAITLDKRIPVGAGLGGGSADAGGVLRVLNAINPRPLPGDDLLGLARSLGADVPFLTQEDAALAMGRGHGERLEALPPLPRRALWLIVPDTPVLTADAYRWVDEEAASASRPALEPASVATWAAVASVAANDFEPVVGKHVPVIGRLLAALGTEEIAGLLGPESVVRLSGSGSAIAVIAGERPPIGPAAAETGPAVTIIETETADFVEPVVLTH